MIGLFFGENQLPIEILKSLKENKYVKTIIDFINSDKKRPISLPINKNENN